MWSLGFALVAAALVSFVILYSYAHTVPWTPLRTAESLYWAKRAVNYTVTSDLHVYLNSSNVALLAEVGNYTVPVAYKVLSRADGIAYAVRMEVRDCWKAVDRSGMPVKVYVVELEHSIDPLPWFEVYAVWLRAGGGWLDPAERRRAAYAIVHVLGSSTSTMYVVVPGDSWGFEVVDYPARFVLGFPTCKPFPQARAGGP